MKRVKIKIKNRVATKSEVSVGHKVALSLLVASAFTLGLNFMGMVASPEINRRVIEEPIEPVVEVEPLVLHNITFAAVGAPVISWPFSSEEEWFEKYRVNFFDGENNLGFLHLGELLMGHQLESGQGITSTIPFALELGGENYEVPNTIIKVYAGDSSYILCLPKTVVTNEKSVRYYYGIDGTPYYDSLLTERAIPIACNYLLAKKLDVIDISDASVINPISIDLTNTTSSPEILFRTNFNNWSLFGKLDLVDNYFEVSNFNLSLRGAPLALEIRGEDFVVPVSLINIEAEDGNHMLCLPETDPSNKDFVRYYYDTNGAPYYDSFLTQKATCSVVVENTCKDTDNGINEYVQGIVSDIDDSGEYSSITDVCVDSNVLEYHCDENIGRTASLINCENGCQDGACLPIELDDKPIFIKR